MIPEGLNRVTTNEKVQPFARVFAAVKSPFTMGGEDLGDTYWADINGNVRITQMDWGCA